MKPPKNNSPSWDIFVRLSHTSYLILLPALYWTATEGMMDIHQYLGISLLVIVVLRILWGFWGSQNARFSTFLYSPARVIRYSTLFFTRNSEQFVSHNPMGGYMVVVMLLLLMIQGILGLFSNDDIFFDGPLVFLIGSELSGSISSWHHLLFDGILCAIGIHLFAVIWYQVYKRQPLIQAMITGKKGSEPDRH